MKFFDLKARFTACVPGLFSVLIVILLTCPRVFGQPGTSMANAIEISINPCGPTNFTDFKTNTSPFVNNFGQSSPEVYYTFVLSQSTTVSTSLCGSNFDTYLYILDINGNVVTYNDDSGPLCAGTSSSIVQSLSAGKYFVVAEGYSAYTGNIALSLTTPGNGGNASPGSGMGLAINAGTFSGSGSFNDVRSNTDPCLGNNFGQPGNDIFYKFMLTSSASVEVSHCGSGFDTYLHLLDQWGTEINFNDDNYGSPCPGAQAFLQMALSAGTYYVVSEGYGNYTGNISTTISVSGGGSQSPAISYDTPTTLALGTMTNISPTNNGSPTVGAVTAVTFAGNGNIGANNGTGTSANFYNPLNTAVDAQGNVYVADGDNHMIRKISPSGVVSTLAGSGYPGTGDGQGSAAGFRHPSAIAIDPAGNIFVSDQQNHRIRKITPAGFVSTFAGSGSAGFNNGTGTAASFSSPIGLAFDANGNLFVADYGNHRIRKIDPSGNVTTFAGNGSAGSVNSSLLNSSFRNPMGLCFDQGGNLYVADRLNHSIRKISPSGSVSTFAGSGSQGFTDGNGPASAFNYPNAVASDLSGNIFVADQQNNSIRKITSSGNVTTLAGNGTAGTVNGVGSAIRLNSPYGLSVDPAGNIFVAESSGQVIRKISTGAYSISPSLPSGLSINASTGVISGIPSELSPMTAYMVTVNTSQGITTTTLSIEVVSLGACISPSADQSYIVTYVPRQSSMTSGIQVQNASCNIDLVQTDIQYFDGLGRPLQNVRVKGSPTGKDVIHPIAYDQFGREDKKYLPYTEESNGGGYRADALHPGSGVFAFYNPGSGGPSGQQLGNGSVRIPTPFSQMVFENGPLNRVIEQGAPGDSWQPVPNSGSGHTKKIEFDINISGEVRLWRMNGSDNGAQHNGEYYEPGTLSKTISKDENWTNGKSGTTEEYKDSDGNLILKLIWKDETTSLSTYYIYDEVGNLRYVLPPAVNDNGQSPLSVFLESDAAFKGFIYGYRYDGRRNAIEKKIPGKGIEYYIYNKVDQMVMSQDANQRVLGKWTFMKYDVFGRQVIAGSVVSSSDRVQWQSDIDGQTVLYESRPNSPNSDYSNDVLPKTGQISLYAKYYYDDYNFQNAASIYAASSGSLIISTMGLVTGTLVYDTDGNSPLWSLTYYDSFGRIKENVAQNHLGGTDRIVNSYDFTSNLISDVRSHNKLNGPVTNIYMEYDYDHRGRKTKTYQKIGIPSSDRVLISETIYNEVDQMKKKLVNNGLNENTFEYNERGWMIKSSSPDFEVQLRYASGVSPSYNGNIDEQWWGTPGNLNKNYVYSYDKLNRLSSGISNTGNHEKDITYDLMGNILSLTRDAGVSQVYTYNGQQLQYVTGGASRSFIYDDNGNVKSDGVNGFDYNIINLTKSITGPNAATYIYNALGEKLRHISNGVITDYVDGIQYTDGVIDFIQTEEGLARRNTDTEYIYQYNLTDHLGNSRYTFNSSGSKLQSDDYYPYGKSFNSFVSGAKNNYLYTGKEFQEGLGQYDYGARFYDPIIGKWGAVDPKSESYFNYSPYNFVAGNPIALIDPNGMEIKSIAGGLGVSFDGEDAVSAWEVLTGKKVNVFINIERRPKVRETENSAPQGFYGEWAVFSAKNFSLANAALEAIGNKELKNLVLATHGGQVGGTSKIRVDDLDQAVKKNNTADHFITTNDILEGTQSKNVKSLRAMSDKVADGGRFILAACFVGRGDMGKQFGQALNKLTKGRLNIFLPMEFIKVPTSTLPAHGLIIGMTLDDFFRVSANPGWLKVSRAGNLSNISSITVSMYKNQPPVTITK